MNILVYSELDLERFRFLLQNLRLNINNTFIFYIGSVIIVFKFRPNVGDQ